MKTEWFHGTFKKIFDLVMEGVIRSGLNKHAVIHDNLSNVRYGTNTDRSPAQAGRKNPKTLNSVFPRKRLADLEGAMTLLKMRNEWDAIIPSRQESQHSEYAVEKIISKRLSPQGDGTVQYLVKWRGYNRIHNTWEPLSNLTNAQRKIDVYEELQRRYEGANTLAGLARMVT